MSQVLTQAALSKTNKKWSFSLISEFKNKEVSTYEGSAAGAASMFQLTLGVYNWDDYNRSQAPAAVKLFFVSYVVIAVILLLNLLIAMLSKTFADMTDTSEKTFRSQWAKFILHTEWQMGTLQRQRVALGRAVEPGQHFPGLDRGRVWTVTENISEEEMNEAEAESAAEFQTAKEMKARQATMASRPSFQQRERTQWASHRGDLSPTSRSNKSPHPMDNSEERPQQQPHSPQSFIRTSLQRIFSPRNNAAKVYPDE